MLALPLENHPMKLVYTCCVGRFALRGCRLIGLGLLTLSACQSPGQRGATLNQNETLQQENRLLRREIAQRDEAVNRLEQQVANLLAFEENRPADRFAPVRVEIASLTGGRDYDDKPGDDGVTVYLRPRDADGDVVKAPGRITIQLLDNADLHAPRVLHVYTFHDPLELRSLWHGRFATNHYTLKCPFPSGLKLPPSRRVTVSVEFVDYLTGATLTAVKEVSVRSAESG